MIKALIVGFVVVCLSMLLSVGCSVQKRELTSQQFWSEFREAVLAQNNQKLNEMTQFPLEVSGVDDSQPSVQYGKEQFEVVFNKILEQPVIFFEGDVVVTRTTKEIVHETTAIIQDHFMTKESFRVDQLVFELKDKQWRLVRAYLEE